MDLQKRLNQAILDRTATDQNINDLRDKIKANQFQPFTIAISVGSKEQAEALYCIFNYPPLMEFVYDELGGAAAEKVRQDIRNMVPDIGNYCIMLRKLKAIMGEK